MFGWPGIIIGIIFILLAAFLIFFFPMTTEHQTEKFGVVGVVLGFILLITGILLIFI